MRAIVAAVCAGLAGAAVGAAPATAPEAEREPARDINDVMVYTMAEMTASDRALDLARRAGSEMLVRGWFKWNQAPPVDRWRDIPAKAHRFGALFGGGITCSALYDGENGLSREQVLDMATRGPDGGVVDAWGRPGIRHGSLSSPAYLDYLFRWCREQIDAGADYLFMDEHNAALQPAEGYDDRSVADFRTYLLEHCPATKGWTRTDPRWRERFGVDPADRAVCPGGDMNSFDHRAYLRARGAMSAPLGSSNLLASAWGGFRAWRDGRAWAALTDRIRACSRERGRTVWISANGLAPLVDLQVLGVWGQWAAKDGRIDLAEEHLTHWRGVVRQGHERAGRRVPVVLFHDWGMGDPPFPWLAVSPDQRELWLRTRGAEIHAAGAFFAFPVLGPFGCDAERDGTLPAIARQTAFYRVNRALYLRGRYLGSEGLQGSADRLSMAVWTGASPDTLVLHVVNRAVRDGRLEGRRAVTVDVPVAGLPVEARAVSPDWDGEAPAACARNGDRLRVTFDRLDAYAVAVLRFDAPPDTSRLADPARARPIARWERPSVQEFRVRADGSIENADELNAYVQGRLHTHLRAPPAFVVHARAPATLVLRVRAVSSAGARLVVRLDDREIGTAALPDRDGKNDAGAAEYEQDFEFAIPAGVQRVTVDNDGPDWLALSRIEFRGSLADAPAR